MTVLTRYGSVYGYIPAFTGRIFYVAPGAAGGGTANTATYQVGGQSFSASDNNDGLSPERALASVGKAITLANTPTSPSSPSVGTSASAGTFDDVIVLLPGTHNVDANSTTGAVIKNGRLLITGVPGTSDLSSVGTYPVMRTRTIVKCSISDHVFNVQADDVEFAFLQVVPTTAKSCIVAGTVQKGLYIHDCVFNSVGITESTSTKGVDLTSTTMVAVQRNAFQWDDEQGPCIVLVGTLDASILNNTFSVQDGALAVTIQCGAATDRVLIGENVFTPTNAGVMTVGVDGTGTTLVAGVHAYWNVFNSVGTVNPSPFKNFGTNTYINLTNNYQGSVGAGAGGALITTAI